MEMADISITNSYHYRQTFIHTKAIISTEKRKEKLNWNSPVNDRINYEINVA